MFSAEATPVLLEGRWLTVRQSTRLGPGMHVVLVTPLVLLLLLPADSLRTDPDGGGFSPRSGLSSRPTLPLQDCAWGTTPQTGQLKPRKAPAWLWRPPGSPESKVWGPLFLRDWERIWSRAPSLARRCHLLPVSTSVCPNPLFLPGHPTQRLRVHPHDSF